MKQRLNKIAQITATVILLAGCGSHDTHDDPQKQTPPEDPVNVEELSIINASDSLMTTEAYREFLQHDPLGSLRCPLPDTEEFRGIADQLGGFPKPYSVPLEMDAALPRVLSGFEPPDPITLANEATDTAAPTITRPDLVGQFGDLAVYLSKKMGLYLVRIDAANPEATAVSCALSLPGQPLNVIIQDGQLLIFANSRDGRHGAVLQFALEGVTPSYQSGLFLENRPIRDVRMFNQTLAILSEMLAFSTADSPDWEPFNKPKNFQMTFVSTTGGLNIEAEDGLPMEQETRELGPDETPGAVRSSTFYYNDFLSASGNYLVVSATEQKEVFSGYETYSYPVCQKYEEVRRQVCRIRWKQAPNPDYVARPSGTVRCGTDLRTCLNQIGPSLNPYIFLPDGQECADEVFQRCVSSTIVTGSYPKFDFVETTRFIIYRFQESGFIRLNDQLAEVQEDQLVATNLPIQIEGSISDHARLNFHGNVFQAVSSKRALTTFVIAGNSVIRTQTLSGIAAGEGRSITTAKFVAHRAYLGISESLWSSGIDQSILAVIDLTQPETPVNLGETTIAGNVKQFFALDGGLLGLGTVSVSSPLSYETYGRVSLFSPQGVELDALLLGSDYKYFSSNALWDDQVARFDPEHQRLILPYSVSNPVDQVSSPSQNRLLLAQADGSDLSESVTFSFDEGIQRSLSLTQDLALAFSDSYVHLLSNRGGWQKNTLVAAVLPNSVYRVPDLPYVLRREIRPGSTEVVVVPEDEIFTERPLSTLSIPRSRSVCFFQQIYFTDNLVLVVSETPGTYTDWRSCPQERDQISLEFEGWQLQPDGTFTSAAPEGLEGLYDKITQDIQCVVDPTNFNGEVIEDDSIDPSTLTCYPREEYDRIRYEHISAENIGE